jgi:uncharacterized phiE125 gp8 family phage protein
MDVLVVTPPVPVVSLALAKAHLDVVRGDQDNLILAYVAAATGQLDGPGGWLGRALGRQTLLAEMDGFETWRRDERHRHSSRRQGFIPLPYPPIASIESVAYDDPQGIEQVLGPDLYTLQAQGLLLTAGASFPATSEQRGCVRITYVAGEEAIPAAIVAAILLMVGDIYQNRETTDTGRVAKIPMSMAVEMLLSPYRSWFA